MRLITGPDLTVRPASDADLVTVSEIYARYVSDTVATFELNAPGRDEWSRRFLDITGAGLPFLVAELGQRVVGYAYCAPWKSRAAYRATVENSIYLAPANIGRGIGTALLADLLTSCAGAGVREVIAVIADTGEYSSIAFHRRHGFVEAGRLTGVGFKHGRWLDTVLLQRSLHGAQPPRA
jgi:phosphinothricin acetyltransferase